MDDVFKKLTFSTKRIKKSVGKEAHPHKKKQRTLPVTNDVSGPLSLSTVGCLQACSDGSRDCEEEESSPPLQIPRGRRDQEDTILESDSSPNEDPAIEIFTGKRTTKIAERKKKKCSKINVEKKAGNLSSRPIQSSRDAEVRKENKIFVWGSDVPSPSSSFADLEIPSKIKPKILENLTRLGFSVPTPVQMQTLPLLLQKREAVVSAPTGSGKTLAFGLPVLLHVYERRRESQDEEICAVILEPTRELAKQTFNELIRMSDGLGIRTHLLPKLKKPGKTGSAQHVSRIDVLVTTPNRLVYELKSEDPRISLKKADWLIVDESDKLFETGKTGFRKQLAKIYRACQWRDIRRALFSATFSYEVEEWCKKSLDNPVMLCVGARNSTVETVEQELMFVGSEQGKLVALRDLFLKGLPPPVLVFVQSRDRAAQLLQELTDSKIQKVDAIHSLMDQSAREKVIDSFRRGETWVLISTDLMARGLDFKAVNVVLNFDFPTSTISYIHRIGRAGRAGRSGRAITFFTEVDKPLLRAIATVMEQSGCHVPEFMMKLPKLSRDKKKGMQKRAPERERIRRQKLVTTRHRIKQRRLKRARNDQGSPA